jgi:hypothetical protein
VRGDGGPIRFWAVAAHYGKDPSDEDLAHPARFLATLGVNGVRVGGAGAGLILQEREAKITDVNQAELTKVWRIKARMKKLLTDVNPYIGTDVLEESVRLAATCYRRKSPVALRTLDGLQLATARLACCDSIATTDRRMRLAAPALDSALAG